MRSLHLLFLFLMLVSIFPFTYARKKKRRKKPLVVQLVLPIVKLGKGSIIGIKNYSYGTYDFYKRFCLGTCTKKERTKAKRNLRWYRNCIIGALIIAGVKWKVDATKRQVDHFMQHKKNEVKAIVEEHKQWITTEATAKMEECKDYIKTEVPNRVINALQNSTKNQIWERAAGNCLERILGHTLHKQYQKIKYKTEDECEDFLESVSPPGQWLDNLLQPMVRKVAIKLGAPIGVKRNCIFQNGRWVLRQTR